MARLIRWYIVEDVTVSNEGSTPEYRVADDRDVAPFPEAWLTARPAFDSREAAVAALAALQPTGAPALAARAPRRRRKSGTRNTA